MEIREIVVPEINSSVDLPQVALPQAPPITLDIGVPVIEIPHFNPMDMEPEVEPQPVKPARSKPATPLQGSSRYADCDPETTPRQQATRLRDQPTKALR